MQGISTPAGNHGNTPRVPAAVGLLASSRVSGLSNSSSSAIASLGDTPVATSPRLMECQRVEAIQQTGQVDIFAEAISELAKAQKLDNGKKEMHDSIATMALKEAKKVEVETQLGQIN